MSRRIDRPRPDGPPTPPAFPVHDFQTSLQIVDNNIHAVGDGSAAALGVTSLTFANFSAVTQQVFLVQAITNGTSCSAAVTGGASNPDLYILLPPQQTTHLAFRRRSSSIASTA